MGVSLESQREEVEQRIRRAKRVWLGLDFDGTLVSIADRPDQVILSPQVRATLETLASLPRVSLAIISGRELADVREKVGIETIAYSGNHGLEIAGPGLVYENKLASELQVVVATMAEQIAEQLNGLPGMLVENKRLSLSVHYRLVAEEHWPVVHRVVEEVTRRHQHFRVKPGAKVWEVRPAIPASKGTAATWLRNAQAGADSLAIFLGDDVTDEDAFRALPEGLTVLVGPERPTAARCRVSDHLEVRELLEWIGSLVM
jgi:trehalose-phosphatase